MTREQLLDWVENLGYLNTKNERKFLNLLLDYLEKIKLFCPIHSERESEFGGCQEKGIGIKQIFTVSHPNLEDTEEKMGKKDKILLNSEDTTDKNLNKISKYYHPLQFFQFILYLEDYQKYYAKESEFYYFLNHGEIKSEKERKNNKHDEFRHRLNGSYWLTPESLKVWIKIDSLCSYKDYVITPKGINISHSLITNFSYTEAGVRI